MEKLVSRSLDSQYQIELDWQERLEAILLSGMDEALLQIGRGPITLAPEFIKTLSTTLLSIWTRTIRESAIITEEDLRIGQKQNLVYDRYLAQYVMLYGRKKAGQIINTTASQLVDRVRGDMSHGSTLVESITKLAQDLPMIARVRAQTILTTEIHAASQYASQKAAERSGLVLNKIWTSVIDDKTRRFGLLGRQDAFNHLIMNNAKVALTQSFSVPRKIGGVEKLHFPGDPQGSAGNIINCRCVQFYERAD